MQQVSQAWKLAQRDTLVPESFVEVKLSVTDPEAEADAKAADNGHFYISDTASIVEELTNSPIKYATSERNLWVLDGSCVLLPDQGPYGRNGYVGSWLCGADGVFTNPPTITISFSKAYDTLLPGLSIDWGTAYGDYATRFRVTVYRGETVTSQDEAVNDTVNTVWEREITHFDKIVVEILAWSQPFHRARIEKLKVGIEKLYQKAELMSYRHSLRVNPLTGELPKSEINFSVKNLNGEYDPYNPTGVERYMMERQSLRVRYGYKLEDGVEWIDGGTFYLNGWDMPQNGIKAGFTARDLLEYMNGKYTGGVSGSLGDIARRAFQQAGLFRMSDGSDRWVIDSVLDGISPPADADLSQNTLAEVVQFCANAACCVMVPDRAGRMVVAPLEKVASSSDYRLDQYVSYSNAELSLEKPLRSVEINNDQYVLTLGKIGEDESITNPLISNTQAPKVARWVADYLTRRTVLTGSWRADPRLDPLDRAINENQFGERLALVTEIEYTYNGAFRGTYKAKEGA